MGAKRRSPGEGSIWKRKDGRWCGAVDLPTALDGTRKRRFVYAQTRAEVAKRLRKLAADRDKGLPAVDERTRLDAYLVEWLPTMRARIRRNTFDRYEALIRLHLAPTLGHHPLAKLTASHVAAFFDAMAAKGQSPRSIQQAHAVLRRALADAERFDLVVRNVARLATPPKVERREVEAMTPDRARSVLAAVRAADNEREAAGLSPLGPLVEVALATGLRQSEQLGLAWRDFDPDAGTLAVRQTLHRDSDDPSGYRLDRPKTTRSRRALPLAPETVATLRRWKARQSEWRLQVRAEWANAERDLIWTDEFGRALDGRNLTKRLQDVLDRAGLGHFRWHDLRHGSATLMLARGVTPRVVMETLGHSTITITMDTYAHVAPEQQREAALAVAGAIYEAGA